MDDNDLGDSRPSIGDPLAGSAWSRSETVAGFVASPPNAELLAFAAREQGRAPGRVAVDLGCGAGRNALPLAERGWIVIGTDLSAPMLRAARQRAVDAGLGARVATLLAPMHELPLRDRCCDLVIAHGIWNLARSGAEFRRAVREAARVSAPAAGLFVFTFSRNTLGSDVRPVDGESFVFTQFAGEPQCFLTAEQLIAELRAGGFAPDPALPMRELNRQATGIRIAGGPPVIYQAAFRRA
jgi:SAM-dependent methyltransferase